MNATRTSQPAPQPATDDLRYEAVRTRNPASNGAFVYAVRTTGIYCRPSCPARLAQRRNISFYPTGEAAKRAGYRPCLRCRPDEASLQQRQADQVRRACRTIDESEDMPTLARLAREAGMSPFHFHRSFKQATGITPRAYAAARRAARLQDSLATARSVTHALYEAGFGAPSRFYEDAAARLGMTPTAYRRGGAQAAIRFAVGQCSLGAILVAATPKGVCAIALADDPAILVRNLQDRFPHAELTGDDPDFDALVARVVNLVEEPHQAQTLPLDIRGTAFQQRVWQALRAIPPGHTASYTDIAASIGAPTATRAVASACAANEHALAIPCHRVVRADGGLSGYRWGIARKAALIGREKGVLF